MECWTENCGHNMKMEPFRKKPSNQRLRRSPTTTKINVNVNAWEKGGKKILMGASTAALDRAGAGGARGLRPSPTLPGTGTPDAQGGAAAARRRHTPEPGVAGTGEGRGLGLGLRPGRSLNGDLIQQPHLRLPLGQAGHKISPLQVFKDLKINSQP